MNYVPFAIGSGFYAIGLMELFGLITVSTAHMIVAATGIGYATVGSLCAFGRDWNNAIVWIGYAFAQIGLYRNLKV